MHVVEHEKPGNSPGTAPFSFPSVPAQRESGCISRAHRLSLMLGPQIAVSKMESSVAAALNTTLHRIGIHRVVGICLALACMHAAESAHAGIILGSAQGLSDERFVPVAGSLSVAVPDSEELPDQDHSQVRHQPSGSASTVPGSASSSVDLAFGELPATAGADKALLVMRYWAEISITIANPFLDGILRPPQSFA